MILDDRHPRPAFPDPQTIRASACARCLHAASALALSTTAKILSLRPKLTRGAFRAPCRLQLENSPVRRKALSERHSDIYPTAKWTARGFAPELIRPEMLETKQRTSRQRGGKAVDELRSSWIQSGRPRRRGRAADTIERGRL